MVGVPRSRGCVSCRQQKKKCEVTLEPPCSRCKRLRIQCVGYGERRLKFLDESQSYLAGRGKKTTAGTKCSPPSLSPWSNSSVDTESDNTRPTVINKSPTNILTTLIASLAHSIDSCNTDTRYSLTWNFGGFLSDVPRYLGSNKALDAAVDALVVGYNRFCISGYANADAFCLEKYSRAISSLRNCLSTIEKACEPGTLCAIMIVMLVETLMGVATEASIGHAGGAAAILKCRGTRPAKDEIEKKVLLSLRGPVAIQAFYLEESFYTEAEWDALISGYATADYIDPESFFDGLASASRLFQKIRKALSQELVSEQEIEQLVLRASDLHQTLNERISDLSSRLDKVRGFSDMQADIDARKRKFDHGSCARDYGLTLATQITINCMLAALHRSWNGSNKGESAWLCREICNLAERDAIHHMPLGSAWVLIALPVAYVGAASENEKMRVIALLKTYSSDLSPNSRYEQTAALDVLGTYLTGGDLVESKSSRGEAVA